MGPLRPDEKGLRAAPPDPVPTEGPASASRAKPTKNFRRNLSAAYGGFAIQAGAALLLTPFLIDRLGPGHFGLWILLITLTSNLQLLEMGLPAALIHHLARDQADPESAPALIGAALWWGGLCAVAAIPLVWGIGRWGPAWFDLNGSEAALFGKATGLLTALMAVTFFHRLFHAIAEGGQRFDLLNLGTAFGTLSMALLVWLLISRGHGLLALLAITLGQKVLELIFLIWVARRCLGLPINPLRAQRVRIRALVRFAIFAAVGEMTVAVAHRIDALVLGLFAPLSAITHFTVAARMAGFLEKAVGPLVALFFPRAAELHGSADQVGLSRLLIQGTRAALFIAVPGLLFLGRHGAELTALWVGADLVEPVLPVLWILLGVVGLAVFEATAGQILLGSGRVRFDAGLSLAIAMANLAISLLLVPRFGAAGAALGTLIPLAVGNLFIGIPYACRQTQTPLGDFSGQTLGPALLLILGIGGGFLLTSWAPLASGWRLAIDAVISGIPAVILLIRHGLGKHDRSTSPGMQASDNQ